MNIIPLNTRRSSTLAETYENRGGLGSKHTIRERLSVLVTKGFVKFLRDPSGFGFPVTRSRFGYLCVEGMQFGAPVEEIDPVTGEVTTEVRPVLPSHFKCPQSGLCLQVENPAVWVYPEGLEPEPDRHHRVRLSRGAAGRLHRDAQRIRRGRCRDQVPPRLRRQGHRLARPVQEPGRVTCTPTC